MNSTTPSRFISDYGRPMKTFFIEVPNFWVWADKLGKCILRYLGYFWPNYQHPFWYSVVSPLSMLPFNHYFYKKLSVYTQTQILIWDWDLNFGLRVSVVRSLNSPIQFHSNQVEMGSAWSRRIDHISTTFVNFLSISFSYMVLKNFDHILFSIGIFEDFRCIQKFWLIWKK